jgi:ABC-type transport system substrate-binding protein/methyl-accepting chemotaxis protein
MDETCRQTMAEIIDLVQFVCDSLRKIARGDLSCDYAVAEHPQSDLVLALDELSKQLRRVVSRLQSSANCIESLATEISAGMDKLRDGTIRGAEPMELATDLVSDLSASAEDMSRSLLSLRDLSRSASGVVASLAASIDRISRGADELSHYVQGTTSAIEQMVSGFSRMAESTEALAESAEKTARAMSAIDDSTRKIEELTSQTNVLSEGVALLADSGSRLVAETEHSMRKIKEAVDAATETIARLGKRGEQIGDLAQVINQIADRTNLLALNAAILAAQVGAQGRGFRIVADEIKELSERTAASTLEIGEMIKAVLSDVDEAIERVAVGGERAQEGVKLAARAAELLAEIREKTTAASEQMRSIADATSIQASESHTVLEAAQIVRQQSRDIERSTAEQAASARALGERALNMLRLTLELRRDAHEQARASKQIAAVMGELATQVGNMSSASGHEAAEVARLAGEIRKLREAAEQNHAHISSISGAVDLLAREAELLSREVGAFKLPLPERGGHIKFALRASQMVLDPATISSISRVEVLSNIFEGLVRFGERGEIRPAIAERWDISPDGRTYTFYIRETARFHNGRRVRAEDVKYSFERQMRVNKEASGWVFRPILGAQEFMSGEADQVAGISLLGEQIVRLELIQPMAFFLSTLCTDYAYIVPCEEVEKPSSDFAIKPIGSGPFRVVEPVLAKEVQLERFSNYWDANLPYVDRLTISFGMSAEEIFEAFLRGELSYVHDLPLTYLEALRGRNGEMNLLEAIQLQTRMLVFDCERPPLSDRRVRQAICYAINREKFLREVYGGMAEPAIGPIPPGLLGYDPAERGYDCDPARARKLLEEAGYGDGFDTEIWWMNSVNPAVECLKEDLAQIGIRAQFRYVSPADMQNGLSLRIVPIAGRDWYADYPDPDNFTYVLFNSRNRNPLVTTYSNEEVDRLTEMGRIVTDRERRAEIYREVTRLLLEDAPCAFLAHRRSFVAYRPGLQGVSLRLMEPFVTPKDLWFAKK